MEKLGKYIVMRRLGAGGMGVVYEGHDPTLNRLVAIKLLPADRGPDPDTRRFFREAESAAQVNHPNCVQIYDIGEDTGRPFLVMELVCGLNAGELVQRSGPLPWADATLILVHACRGMNAIHDKGLIHRDVKPSNILISESGAVKLADFGLAKTLDKSAESLSGQRTVGTPHYMSPEQCWNESVDARTDLYALGATYYSLLTGQPPYQAERDLQVMFAHCNNPPPDPRTVRPELPQGCFEVIQKAMAKAPADRYQTAADLQAAFEAILGSNPAPATLSALNLATPSTADLPPLSLPLPSTRTEDGPTPATGTRPISRRGALLAIAPAVAAAAAGIFISVRGCGDATREGPHAKGTEKGPDQGNGNDPTTPTKPKDTIPPIQDGFVWQMSGPARAVAISEDSRYVALAMFGAQGQLGAKLFDRTIDSPEPILWDWKNTAGLGVALSPDSKLLAVASERANRVILYDIAAKEEVKWDAFETLSPVGAVAFSPDGKLFAAALNWWRTATDQPVVRLWSVKDGQGTHLRDLNSGSAPIRQISFSPDSGSLAVSISNGLGLPTVKRRLQVDLWDLRENRIQSISTPGVEVGPSAVFARKAWILAVARPDLIDLYLSAELDRQRPAWNSRREALSIALSPNGKLLAAAFADGIHLYDVDAGKPRAKRLDRHTGLVFDMTFTADGRHLISTGGDDRTVRFWEVPS